MNAPPAAQASIPATIPAVLLSYQQELLSTTATEAVVVYEKSRRIGISWAAASEAVLASAASREAGGMDTMYIGYNLEMARGFIDDAAFWARHFSQAAEETQEFLFKDGDKKGDREIQAFRIRFASGFEIVALSSRPRSLRSKQGFVIIDEAAFHDDLAGLLKAAFALLIWGGRVWVISTHDGVDNPFNDLVEEVRAGKKPYKLLRTTFDEAIEAGLYDRVKMMMAARGLAIKPKAEWVAEIRAIYGDDAEEELDVIPSQGTGVWLTRAMIDGCMSPHYRVVRLTCEPGFEQKPDHVRKAYVEAWLEDQVKPLLDHLDPASQSLVGGDFARTVDLSVLMPGQIGGNNGVLRVPFCVEMRNVPFREQEQVIYYIIGHLPRFRAGAFDARGLGAMLAELAMQKYGASRIAEIKATADWYRDNMAGLKARFEDRTIQLPRDDDLRNDFRMVKVNKGVPMVPENVRKPSSRGGTRHGDAAIAAVMLHHASEMEVAPIESQSTGQQRSGIGAFQDEPGDVAPLTETGFGTVGGSSDLRGF